MQDPKDLEDLTGETVDFVLVSSGYLRHRGKVIDGKGDILKIELPGRIISVSRYWLIKKGKIHPEASIPVTSMDIASCLASQKPQPPQNFCGVNVLWGFFKAGTWHHSR